MCKSLLCIDTFIHGKIKSVRKRNDKNKLESIEERAEKKKARNSYTDKNLFRSYPAVVNTEHSVDTDKFRTQKTKTNRLTVAVVQSNTKKRDKDEPSKWKTHVHRKTLTQREKHNISSHNVYCSVWVVSHCRSYLAPNGSAFTRSELTKRRNNVVVFAAQCLWLFQDFLFVHALNLVATRRCCAHRFFFCILSIEYSKCCASYNTKCVQRKNEALA